MVFMDKIVKPYRWNCALVEQLPEWYIKDVVKDIETGRITELDKKFFAKVGEEGIDNVKDMSKLDKRKLFAQLEKNAFLKELDEIENGEDIIKVLKQYKYRDARLERWSIFLKGDKEWAKKIVERLEELGWIKEEKVPGKVFIYENSNSKWRIKYRTEDRISLSSKKKLEAAWYKIEAAIDFENKINEKQFKFKFIILKQ